MKKKIQKFSLSSQAQAQSVFRTLAHRLVTIDKGSTTFIYLYVALPTYIIIIHYEIAIWKKEKQTYIL